MAFPVIASISTDVASTFATPKAITKPAGVAVGDLLLILSGFYSVASSPSTGWTTLITDISSGRLNLFARIADGGANDTCTITASSTHHVIFQLRITGHSVANVATDVPARHNESVSTASFFNPLNAGSVKDWKWLAASNFLLVAAGGSFTNFPANYTAELNTKSAGSGVADLFACYSRNLQASSTTPGDFICTASRPASNLLIAVPGIPDSPVIVQSPFFGR